MSQVLRQSTQVIVVIGPFVDVTDGFTPETGVTLSGADEAELLKANTSTTTDISGATFAAITGCDGWYALTLTTSLTDTVGALTVMVNDDSVCLPVFARFQVIEEAAYDAMYAASADPKADINVASIDANAITATAIAADAITAAKIADGAIDANTFAAGAINAAAIATGAVDADALAADAVAEIADGVWDEAMSGHTTLGTFGQLARSQGLPGEVNDGAATTTSFIVDGFTEATNDHFNGMVITFTSGACAGQSRTITDYVGATQTVTLGEALTDAPADNDDFIISPGPMAGGTLQQVWRLFLTLLNSSGQIQAGTLASDTITDAKVASDVTIASVTGAVGSVTGNVGGNVTGSVGSVAAGGISASSFAAGAIDATAIADNAIDAGAIAANALTAAKIADGAIDAATFAADVDAEILSYLVDDATRIDASALNTATGTSIPAILEDTGTTLQAEVDGIQADTEDIQSRLPALLVGGRIDASVGAMAAGVLTAAAVATDAIDADALAADAIAEINATVDAALADIHLDHLLAVDYDAAAPPGDPGALWNQLLESDESSPAKPRFTAQALEQAPGPGSFGDLPTAGEIADAVWDEARSGHVSAGSFGEGAASVQGNVTGSVGSVAAGGITAASIATDAIDGDAIAASAVTEIQSGLATASALADVQSDTNDIQSRLPAALVSGRIDASVGAYQTGLTPLQPTVAGRTLDVNAGGEAGIDLDNTSGTLAKGTDITGFNDVSAAQVNAEADTALADVGLTTIITGRIDAAVSTRASQTSVDTVDDFLDTEIAAIKAKTDSLTFTVANQLDANVQSINDTALQGNGSGATPWAPV